MRTSIDSYKESKKACWIRRQLAQGMLVYFREQDRLFVIKSVEEEPDGLHINKTNKKLDNQILYAAKKSDPTQPLGKFEDKPLAMPEYVDLICKCF